MGFKVYLSARLLWPQHLLPLLTAVLFHIPFFALIFIRLHFPFPFLPEHPLFEDATVFRCVLSGSQLWRAPSPHPTRLPALPNHHSPHGSQRRGAQLPLSRRHQGQLSRQWQLLRGGRGRGWLVPLQPDAGRPAHQVWQLQVRRPQPVRSGSWITVLIQFYWIVLTLFGISYGVVVKTEILLILDGKILNAVFNFQTFSAFTKCVQVEIMF